MVSIQQFTPQRHANIKSEHGKIIVSDAGHEGCRCPGDFFYAIDVQQDSISIQGDNSEQGQVGYQLALSPQGVQVQSTIGHPETVMNLASDSPLTPEKQKQVGLNVASSLIGLPLVNLEKATPSGK